MRPSIFVRIEEVLQLSVAAAQSSAAGSKGKVRIIDALFFYFGLANLFLMCSGVAQEVEGGISLEDIRLLSSLRLLRDNLKQAALQLLPVGMFESVHTSGLGTDVCALCGCCAADFFANGASPAAESKPKQTKHRWSLLRKKSGKEEEENESSQAAGRELEV